METVMSGFEKHAEFYRAYLTEERSLIPLTVALATIVALWLLVYLVAAIGPAPAPSQRMAAPSAHVPVLVHTAR